MKLADPFAGAIPVPVSLLFALQANATANGLSLMTSQEMLIASVSVVGMPEQSPDRTSGMNSSSGVVSVGVIDGAAVGVKEGISVGVFVGFDVGVFVGTDVGVFDGRDVGVLVGAVVGV